MNIYVIDFFPLSFKKDCHVKSLQNIQKNIKI